MSLFSDLMKLLFPAESFRVIIFLLRLYDLHQYFLEFEQYLEPAFRQYQA
jgi:hypothetical protein